MKKANLLACLLSPMLAIAQPQADSLRHLIHVKGPQVHLLAQMAEATATSHPRHGTSLRSIGSPTQGCRARPHNP